MFTCFVCSCARLKHVECERTMIHFFAFAYERFHNARNSIVLQFLGRSKEVLKLGSALGRTYVCDLVVE